MACGRGIEPDKRVRKQVDFASVTQRNRHGLPAGIYAKGNLKYFASVTQRNRHGLPAGIYAKGIPSPAPPVFADAKPR